MDQNILKWRAPRDFARHSIFSFYFTWLALAALWLLWLLGQWIVTRREPKELSFTLIMLGGLLLMIWNHVPRYKFDKKSLYHTDSKGHIERDWNEVESYSIRWLPQICHLRVIEFECVPGHKRKQLPSFVFDPRQSDEAKLRAFLAHKLPEKEIAAEESTREYSQAEKPLLSWRKSWRESKAEMRADALSSAKFWMSVFLLWLVLHWLMTRSLPSPHSVLLNLAALIAGGVVWKAIACWPRPRFALGENGATCEKDGKVYRFLWSSVAWYSMKTPLAQPHFRELTFTLKNADLRIGGTFVLLPAFTFDAREVEEARVLAVLREKVPERSEQEKNAMATEMIRRFRRNSSKQADKLRAL